MSEGKLYPEEWLNDAAILLCLFLGKNYPVFTHQMIPGSFSRRVALSTAPPGLTQQVNDSSTVVRIQSLGPRQPLRQP